MVYSSDSAFIIAFIHSANVEPEELTWSQDQETLLRGTDT